MTERRIDELVARAGAATPDWNEVRERRVLAAMQRAPRAKPRRWRTRGAVAAIAVAAAAAVGLWLSSGPEGASTAGRLELADGSRCRLSADARVRVLAQSDRLIRLEQSAGEVEYAVTGRPERAFEVVTDAAVVRVRGTRFTVSVEPEAIAVAVSEGLVEVEARGQRTSLSVGDALRVSREELQATAAAPRDDPAGAPTARPTGREAGPGPVERPDLPGEVEPAGEVETPGPPEARRDPRRDRATGAGATARRDQRSDPRARPGPTDTEEEGPPPSDPNAEGAPSAASLLALADTHRREGRASEAARTLERLLDLHPDDPRAASAAFTLGRLERRLGHPARAAVAFARSRGAAPAGPLAEDALAEEATAFAAAGDLRRAREAAQRYLALHPDGLHAPRMRPLAE